MNGTPPSRPRRGEQFRNWISLTGLVVATGSVFSFLFLFAIDVFSHNANPYMGILAYVVSPIFFFIGMFLLVLGAWIHRRRAKAGALPHAFTIDLSRPK